MVCCCYCRWHMSLQFHSAMCHFLVPMLESPQLLIIVQLKAVVIYFDFCSLASNPHRGIINFKKGIALFWSPYLVYTL